MKGSGASGCSLQFSQLFFHLKIRKESSLSLLPDLLCSGDQSIPFIG